MLFTREQLEGFYYLMVGILLLVGIPLFCERFHSGGDDGGEEEALWAEVGGAGVDAPGSAGSSGDGSAGGSGSGSFYDDSLFLPSSNSSSSNTPRSSQNSASAGGSAGDAGSAGSGDGSTGSSGSFGAGSGSSAANQSGGGTNSGGYSSEGSGNSASNSLGSGGAGSAGGGTTSGGSSGTTAKQSGVGSTKQRGSQGSSGGSSGGSWGGSSGKAGGSQGRTQGQREVKVVEINRADSALLTTVRGIGPVYASIIIRYRERLGGFFDMRQLKELNLKYLDYDAVAPYLRVDTTFIKKQHIENLTFKELLRHPYLEYEEVSLIFQYERENPGEPVTIEQLGEAGILRSAQIKKLSPYFY